MSARLLSLHLILGRQYGETLGRSRTRWGHNHKLSLLGTEWYQCLFILPLPLVVWCKWLPLIMGPNTHLSQESEAGEEGYRGKKQKNKKKGGYRGRWNTACCHCITPRDEAVISENVYKLQNGCCLTSTLQISQKNLSYPFLW